MEKKIVEFTNLLRKAGVRVSVAESLDAFTAIDEMPLEDRELFRDALRATMVKRGDDIETYDRLFDLFWSGFHDQLQSELKQALGGMPGDFDLERLLEQLREMLENMPDDARKREMLYQHDVGVSRIRTMLKQAARTQLEAEDAHQQAAG